MLGKISGIESIENLRKIMKDKTGHLVKGVNKKYTVSTDLIISALVYLQKETGARDIDSALDIVRSMFKNDKFLTMVKDFVEELNRCNASGRVMPPINALGRIFKNIASLNEAGLINDSDYKSAKEKSEDLINLLYQEKNANVNQNQQKIFKNLDNIKQIQNSNSNVFKPKKPGFMSSIMSLLR